MGLPLLSTILLCPLVAFGLILCLPGRYINAVRWIALTAATLTLLLSIQMMRSMDFTTPDFQFIENYAWMPAYGIRLSFGIDGMSAVMILLTAIIIFCGVICSWTIKVRVKEFYANLLFLVAGVFGVFMSTNLFFFFLFYEIAVLPMYFLIAIWGSTNRNYAAMKLTLYLLAGSTLIFTGFLMLYAHTGSGTFELMQLHNLEFSRSAQIIYYAMFFIGFGVLSALFPFHVWSPVGHVAAPTAASMLHAGVLMKLGAYGIIRIGLVLFPEGARFWAPTTAILAVCGIIYGAMIAVRQRDIKFIIGYSSVSHMGIVLLGISSLNSFGLEGAIFQMFSHGIMTALFFACIGYIYDHCHTRSLDDLGGLVNQAPRISVMFIIAGLVGLGLPGFSGFVAEFLVIVGAIQAFPIIGIISTLALLITAFYVLSAIQSAFFGPVNSRFKDMPDIKSWQIFPRAILIMVLLVFGVAPKIFLDWIIPTSSHILQVYS
ncbi:MAG: NADH-quinone oxidoreductase subunit M [Candidatus Omnitrophota bacterium]|jgi:NADH-quinone oxidoreductase subunit M